MKEETILEHNGSNDPELDFIGGFMLLAGGLWVLGAAVMLTMVLLGAGR